MEQPIAIQVRLHLERFDPLVSLQQWEQQLLEAGLQRAAACSSFIGRVRAGNANASSASAVIALELEHYPGMTEAELQRIAESVGRRHGALACLIEHRVGRIAVNDAIVCVAVLADRRGPAQRCCQELLEELKHNAPFWKREWSADGSSQWIEGNTPL